MFECCVLSSRGLRDELITRPEEPYPLWRVVVGDLETSRMRRPWPTGDGGCCAKRRKDGYINFGRQLSAYILTYIQQCITEVGTATKHLSNHCELKYRLAYITIAYPPR